MIQNAFRQFKPTKCPSGWSVLRKRDSWFIPQQSYRALKTAPNKWEQTGNRITQFHEKVRDSVLVFEAKQGPLGKAVVGIGQALLTAGIVFGSGALPLYLIIGKESREDAVEGQSESFIVPGDLHATFIGKERIATTYQYLCNSLTITALGAVASFRIFSNPKFLHLVSSRPLLALGGVLIAQYGLQMMALSLPYKEGFHMKQVLSCAHALVIGLAAAPLFVTGGQAMIRAGFISAGIIGGITGVGTLIPRNDAFNKWERPLKVGVYAALLSFMALWIVPRHHIVYDALFKVAMYGGLLVFPAHYLYQSKLLAQKASEAVHFDPINSSMHLYTDIMNIYARLALLLPPYYTISARKSPGPGRR